MLDGRGSILCRGIQTGSGTNPAFILTGTGQYYSPQYNAEIKNTWRYTSTPQYVFMAWCLVKHRDNFTFTFTGHYFKLCLFTHISWHFEVVKQVSTYNRRQDKSALAPGKIRASSQSKTVRGPAFSDTYWFVASAQWPSWGEALHTLHISRTSTLMFLLGLDNIYELQAWLISRTLIMLYRKI
jgi:hypothetical protein